MTLVLLDQHDFTESIFAIYFCHACSTVSPDHFFLHFKTSTHHTTQGQQNQWPTKSEQTSHKRQKQNQENMAAIAENN